MINLNLAKLVLIELILEQTNKLKQGEDAQWEEDTNIEDDSNK